MLRTNPRECKSAIKRLLNLLKTLSSTDLNIIGGTVSGASTSIQQHATIRIIIRQAWTGQQIESFSLTLLIFCTEETNIGINY